MKYKRSKGKLHWMDREWKNSKLDNKGMIYIMITMLILLYQQVSPKRRIL